MNELSSSAIIGAVVLYLAKTIYEVVKNGRNNKNGNGVAVHSNGSVGFSEELKKCIYDTNTIAVTNTKVMEKIESKMSEMVSRQERTNMLLEDLKDVMRD